MQIEYVNIDEIKPYKNNAKLHPQTQIEQIKKSIEEFGMNDPIATWNNEIVEGHGRYIALQQLGYKEIPCIKLDNLTDEQRKAYTLIHNKLTMNSDFDIDLLNEELENIIDINMEDFGFDILEDLDIEDDFKEEFKVNERERTNQAYNLELFDAYNCEGKWQMPIIDNDNYIPTDSVEGRLINQEKATDSNTYISMLVTDERYNNADSISKRYMVPLSKTKNWKRK